MAFGYPADVIAAAQASSDEVLAAVRAGAAPYDGTPGAGSTSSPSSLA